MGDVSSTNVLCDKMKVGENNVLMEPTENSDKGSKSIMVPRTGGYSILLWWHNPNEIVPVTRIRQFFLERIADLPQVKQIIGLFAFWGRSTFLEAVLLVITRSTLMNVFWLSSNPDTSLTFIFHPLQDIYSKVLVRLTNLILENQGKKSNYLLTTWFALFTSIGTYVLWLMQF